MRRDLQQAHDAADLRGTLDEALRHPLLRRCLEITARALQSQTTNTESKPAVVLYPFKGRKALTAPAKDFKRACAGDLDE